MSAGRLVEIRTYRLKPGSGGAFHELVVNRSMPLLAERGVDVVAFGPSRHDPDGYFLVRAYDDLDHLRRSEDEFYSSAAWREGPREEILALIESDLDAVLWLSEEAVEAIRESGRSAP